MINELMNPLFLNPNYFTVAINEDNNDILAFAQIKPISSQDYELASVFVEPHLRRKGLGSSVIYQSLENHFSSQCDSASSSIFLLTLADTIPFYSKQGFELYLDFSPATRMTKHSDDDDFGDKEGLLLRRTSFSFDGRIKELPPSLALEVVVGYVITRIIGKHLVCMKYKLSSIY
mmetsp:Transcript_15490/g.18955  ORF Transcript_15490/g.18955 Transcript_15490/m.18955 type:complete len:175 (+) Transcript_15490:368-892(+)